MKEKLLSLLSEGTVHLGNEILPCLAWMIHYDPGVFPWWIWMMFRGHHPSVEWWYSFIFHLNEQMSNWLRSLGVNTSQFYPLIYPHLYHLSHFKQYKLQLLSDIKSQETCSNILPHKIHINFQSSNVFVLTLMNGAGEDSPNNNSKTRSIIISTNRYHG